jgi:hypothetical protein
MLNLGILGSIVALIAGLVTMIFASFRKTPQSQRLFLKGLCVGGIVALGWGGAWSSNQISGTAFIIIIAIIAFWALCGALFNFLAHGETITQR